MQRRTLIAAAAGGGLGLALPAQAQVLDLSDAINKAAAMPFPVTSAITTLNGRPRRRSRKRSKKSPPTSRAAS